MSQGSIHVIDDEPVIRDVLEQLLQAEGYDVTLSESGEAALSKFADNGFDLVLLDLLMPGRSGLEILPEIKKIQPSTIVIIITAYASVESAIQAMKIGAYDYVQKPFKHEDLLLTIERALAHKTLLDENDRLREELRKKFSFSNILGRSRPMERVFELIKAAAPTRSTILVQGESGTGKELVARAIHTNSPRASFPFIVVNSGALPPDLLESHLFGHVKGAFTGAVSEKQGLFEAADKGTIFFDEISTIGLETQAKLLRVMQDREFMRLGGTKTIRVDVRIIAATNRDLEQAVREGKFRPDLFHRLNVFPIHVPPLRERPEDIPALVWSFVEVLGRRMGKTIKSIPRKTIGQLQRYSWPGNVRELSNIIERAMILAAGDTLHVELPSASQSTPSPRMTLMEVERAHILRVLQETGWRIRGPHGAAEILGTKPTTLEARMARLGIKRQKRDSNIL